MKIGETIAKIRNIKGLTQKELADKMESNQGYISGIERNEYI